MVYSLPKSWVLFCGLAAILSPLATPASAQQPSTNASPAVNTKLVGQKSVKTLVTIDPGHGGKDPGAIGLDGLREVDVILPIALQVAKILQEKGVDTQLTRDSDYFVGLDQRVVMSRKAGASIFVSIHANSIDNRPDVHGLETYHYHRGLELANIVHSNIVQSLAEKEDPEDPLVDRGVRSARFLVLRKSEIPAILVEVGYLTSPTESLKLSSETYRERMATAIAKGILEYLGKSADISASAPPSAAPAPVKPLPSLTTVPSVIPPKLPLVESQLD
jgi:N-acetylmuramoyl-L-alanine amidase